MDQTTEKQNPAAGPGMGAVSALAGGSQPDSITSAPSVQEATLELSLIHI